MDLESECFSTVRSQLARLIFEISDLILWSKVKKNSDSVPKKLVWYVDLTVPLTSCTDLDNTDSRERGVMFGQL